MKRILIVGGYGNFGSYIARKLAAEKNIALIISGRNKDKAIKLAEEIKGEYAVIDINKKVIPQIKIVNPDIVIHTSGPFQGQNYNVAEACIELGCHYIDLADGREFVFNIKDLNNEALNAGVFIISGASSVPCLSSAVVEKYRHQFKVIESIEYGIATAQQTNRGLATTEAILSYTGKPFKTLINKKMRTIYGWQGLHLKKYPDLGWRCLSNCEIPDLSLFPERYPELKTIRFYAGTEIFFQHIGLWLLSWLVRWKVVSSLKPLGAILVKAANMFDWMGSSNSAFHMDISGLDQDGNKTEKNFYIIAKDGDGPYIPCMPAVILAKKIVNSKLKKTGAFSGMDLISFEEYFDGLDGLNIHWYES